MITKLLRATQNRRRNNPDYTAKLLVDARYFMAGIDNKNYTASHDSVTELLDYWLQQWLEAKHTCPNCGDSKYP
jgi:hypothetical protein